MIGWGGNDWGKNLPKQIGVRFYWGEGGGSFLLITGLSLFLAQARRR